MPLTSRQRKAGRKYVSEVLNYSLYLYRRKKDCGIYARLSLPAETLAAILKAMNLVINFLRLFILFVVITMFLNSCDEDNESAPTYPNYSQLKVGNYWVYQIFEVDSVGNATSTNSYDSCFVQKDTVINNQTYYKLFRDNIEHYASYRDPWQQYWFVRDSLQYIVTSSGEVIFSSQDFDTTFSIRYTITASGDTCTKIESKMVDKDLAVTTPAGSFVTSNFQRTIYLQWYCSGFWNPRHLNTRYSENIGIIVETLPFYLTDSIYVERRLARYHLN